MCLSRDVLPGRGAATISPFGRERYACSDRRPHAIGLPDAATQSSDCAGQGDTAAGPWHH